MSSTTKARQRNSNHTSRDTAGRRKSRHKKALSRELQRQLGVETLEARWLLAPMLFGARPDEGDLLTVNSVDVVQTSPSEIQLLFKGGAKIDSTTIANGVRVFRSGFDDNFANGSVTVTPAYINLGDNGTDQNSIVMRFGQTLPDDRYRIEVYAQSIFSLGVSALTDTAGVAFAPSGSLTDRDRIEFDLDLGAQVISVVPQPVSRVAGALQQAGDTIVAYLNNDDLNATLAAAPTFYRLVDTKGTLTPADDQLYLARSVAYNSASDTATLVFDDDNNPGTAYTLPAGTWRLDIGLSDEPNNVTSRAVRVGSLYNTTPYSTLSYLGDGNNTSGDSADVDLYRVRMNAGATLNLTVTPNAGLDVAVRLLRADGTTVVPVTMTSTGGVGTIEAGFNTAGLPASEDYFVEVTGAGGTVGGYRLALTSNTAPPIGENAGTTNDDDSSFTTSNNLGVLGDAGVLISAAVTPPTLALPQYPGGNDEPGHRLLPADGHSGTEGLDLVASDGITVQYYNFAVVDPNNLDGNGNPYPNLITAEEKQLVRDIYELYTSVTGIRFVEDTVGLQGTRVMVGDLRAATPTATNGPGGVAGLGGGSLVVLDALEGWGANRKFGSSFFSVMLHEIGHSLGLEHSYDIPAVMGGGFTSEPVYPGDADIIHLNRLHRPDNIDIDMYAFTVEETGTFSAEIRAERLPASSLLDSVLRLYRENADGTRELISQNDDFYSDDSYVQMTLAPGKYYLGVSSVGNEQYNPEVLNSGFGGRSEGNYQLQMNFLADPARSLIDATGTPIDGDSNGVAGGQFQFWFRTGPTIFVDKMADTIPNVAQGTGTLASPYDTISTALAAATAGQIVRIVGNGGADGNVATTADNRPYLIGLSNSNNPLVDGSEFLVPANVTVMVDAGALFKMRSANIDVGTSTIDNPRAGGSLQVLGTPTTPVYFRSLRDDTIGGDSDGASPTGAKAGDWGGLVFRDSSDKEANGIFLNWVSHANMNHGGGKVFVGTNQSVFTPIHLESARPTIVNTTITNSADAAMSADPNSFDDQIAGNTDKRLHRYGPDIHRNSTSGSTVNGLFIRIETDLGSPLDKMDVTARFDDKDIVHVLTENLLITGNSGGAVDNGAGPVARTSGRLLVDPGVVVKLGAARIEAERGSAQVIAEGNASAGIVFTSLSDDTFGAGGTFDTNGDGSTSTPAPGNWGGLFFNHTSRGSFDHVQISYAGGRTSIEGSYANFAPIEAQQATLRITNSLIENNADGADSSNRNGRMDNVASTIFVRGAQPVIVNNVIQDNAGSAIHINANALDAVNRKDYGRSTGAVDSFSDFDDNYGPLIRLNRMADNAANGLEVRSDELTTESVWDDTDIVHIVRGEIEVATSQNHHTYSGLRLQSSADASLVVKLQGANAGFTVNGELHELDDRIGGAIQVLGTIGHPVVMTALIDCSVGAGFTPDGRPQNDTVANGACGTSVITVAPPYADVLVVIDESSSMGQLQDFTEQMIPALDTALIASGIGDGTVGTNRFGLVGYGGPSATAAGHSLTVGTGLWGDSVEYVAAAQNLVTISGAADGYKGLDFALANYTFRGSAAKFIILVTDTNRENFGGGGGGGGGGLSPSTPASLLAQFSAADITLQTIVNARFLDAAGTTAIAVDSTGTAFIPDGLGGYTTTSGGYADPTFNPGGFGGAGRTADIINSYINLGWATGGISGSIEPIAAGGTDQLSFVAAFTDSIVDQSQEPQSAPPGEWRSIQLGQYSNDRNVETILELEPSVIKGTDVNGAPAKAQDLGVLAPNEKSGDENRRLGFEVLGRIAYDAPTEADVYSFTGTAGTPVWIDIDRTDSTLDSRVELITFAGASTAGSDDSFNNATLTGAAQTMMQNVFLSEDNYSLNVKDAGFYVVLPGTAGQTGKYFVRVSSNGKTSGQYQLQVRLRQQDEEPGSTIRRTDIRNATTGIEVIGLPARSNLAGESGENGDASANANTAQVLGNLLSSDRNTVSVAGSLSSGTDVDWYNINLLVGQIQRIPGVNANTTVQWPLVFDVDYADGLVRPDSTLSVFDSTGRLILIGRESSVADDQPVSSGNLSLDDLSRGSVGKLDPFIGPIIVNEGTDYDFAVTSNQQTSIQLQQYFTAAPVNADTRLEPIESVTRVVEDHIGTSGYVSSNGLPVAPSNEVFDIDTTLSLDTHIKSFTLDDVRLYVSTDTTMFSVDADDVGFSNLVNVGTAGNTGDRLRDIVIRSDGMLYGYRDRDTDTIAADNDVGDVAGTLVRYNPGDASVITSQNDGIRGPVGGTAFAPSNPVLDVTYSDGVEALTFRRLSWQNADTVDYDLYYSVTDPLAGAPPGGSGYSKLYEDLDGPRPDGAVNQGNANRGFVGYIGGATRGFGDGLMGSSGASLRLYSADPGQSATLTVTQNNGGNAGNSIVAGIDITVGANSINVVIYSNNGGRTITAQELVNAINAFTAARNVGTVQLNSGGGNRVSNGTPDSNGIPNPNIGGGNWFAGAGSVGTLRGRTTGMAFVGDVLYGVSDRGELYTINTANATTTTLRTYNGVSFQGLALGPQNLDVDRDGTPELANFLFAIDSNGLVRAINTANTAANPAIFDGGATTLDTGVANPTGLAFSNLDFNLWHPTTYRGDEAGHGVNATFNNSRPAAGGGNSFYFGLENANTGGFLTYDVLGGPGTADGQYGITSQAQFDLNTNTLLRNTYDLPGGAKGTLLTDSFSLGGYSRDEKPTLYFNYFLDTEGANGAMRDSARVFISQDGGTTWEMVASNNSVRGNEIAPVYTHDSTSNPNADPNGASPTALERSDIIAQQVQELFDVADWRQARVDLSAYAGQTNLRFRFDFATAGAIDEPGLPGEANGDLTSNTRGQNNNRNGFFVDDIIVGFSERGELVTGARADDTRMVATNDVPAPAPPPQLAGSYQIEVRRGADYGGNFQDYSTPGVNRLFDTNDRIVQEDTLTGTTPSDNFNRATLRTATSLPWQTGGYSDWSIVGNRANASLSTIGIFNPADIANSEFTVLQVSLETRGGVMSFTEFSTFADSIFFIDGVNVDRFLVTGNPVTGAQQYTIEPGLHTFTWVGAKVTNTGFESTAIDNVLFPAAIVGTGDKGDDNFFREQGQLILRDNKISNSLNYGIDVQAGTRDPNQNLPHPGVPINFNTLNSNRWVPGTVIENNILAGNVQGGIRYAGDASGNPLAVVPYGRIVNNTIYGGKSPNGDGIVVTDNASPTILNNIIANTVNAITTAGAGTVVIGSNFYYNNNSPTLPSDLTAGTSPLFAIDGDPLFNNSAAGVYYPAAGSLAIDSSQNTLSDRAAMNTVKAPLGIPQSPISAPNYDIYGQLRVDDTTADPLGGGSSIFKDRGAVESSDAVGPYAQLLSPLDNDDDDSDLNSTVVFRRTGLFTEFAVLLSDGPGSPFANEGTGVDPDTVLNDTTFLSNTVTVKQDGVVLQQNVAYTLGYSANNQTLLIKPLSDVWEPNHVYEILLANQDPVFSIRDYAGNVLRGNQADNSVKFTIVLGDLTMDFGDGAATIGGFATTFPTTLAQDGARHVQMLTSNPLFLGAVVDSESDAIQTSDSSSDNRVFNLSFSTTPASTLVLTSAPGASPAIFQVPAGTAGLTVGVVDGETFTIDDKVHAPVTFEIELSGGLTVGTNIGINVVNTRDRAEDVAKSIVDAIRSQIDAGNLLDVRPVRVGSSVSLTQFGVNDEDGVDFSSAIFNADTNVTRFAITSSGAGFVDAWIDFNNDGTYQDSEKILDSRAVVAGVNNITLNNITPAGSFEGDVNGRFRVSAFGGLPTGGLVAGGEVEDYSIWIRPGVTPIAVRDTYVMDEDGSLNVNAASGLLANDTDADVPAQPLTVQLVTGPTHATVGGFTLNADGSFLYTPVGDYYGTDTFVYRAVDSIGLLSNSPATVTITIRAVNDAPVNNLPPTQSTNEDTALALSAAGSNLLSITDDAGILPISVTLTAANGTMTLAGTTGLTFTTGDGSGDATMTFSGTPTRVNAALDGLVFDPTPDFFGDATIVVHVDDQGNRHDAPNSGASLTDTDTLTITVNPVNDAPVNSVPPTQLMNEDIAFAFSTANGNRISISDDSGLNPIVVTLTASTGSLTLPSTTGLTFLGGTANGMTQLQISGTLADVNAALDGLSLLTPLNYNGSASLIVNTNDQGFTGGGALSDVDTISITVAAVNDAPVNGIPAVQTINEDTTLTFSTANGNPITVSDVDATGPVRVTLTGVNGLVTVNGTAGLVFVVGDGSADPTMTFTGTMATINSRLSGLQFRPLLNFDGTAYLTIFTEDLGQSGNGGPKTDLDTVTVTVLPQNDAPVNNIPGSQSTPEDTALVFHTSNGNRVSISDDSGVNPIEVTMTSTNGVMTLPGTTGLTFLGGTTNGSASLRFNGSLADINAALLGLSFAPTANYNGPATIVISTNDQGNSGQVGAPALTDTDTISISVTAVNDAPVNTIPAPQGTLDAPYDGNPGNEGPLVFSTANGNAISISDIDAGGGSVRVSLSALDGVMTLSTIVGLAFTVGDGSGDASMSFTGTIARINAALEGMSFRPNDYFVGPTQIVLTTNDLGLTGSGGQQTDTDAIGITVTADNDRPVNTVPGTLTIDEDTSLVLSGSNRVLVADDSGAAPIQVRVTATSGALLLTQTTGLTFQNGSTNGSGTIDVLGSLANINAALNGMTFTPPADFFGSVTVTIATDDLGNAPVGGGSLTDTDSFTVNVSAVNDAPVNTVPSGPLSVAEDTTLNFGAGGFAVTDVDAGSNLIQVGLTTAGGLLQVVATGGLATIIGNNSGNLSMTGTRTAINAALDTLSFTPANDASGDVTVTMTTSDLGNFGSGGTLTDVDSVTINVTPVNDAPVIVGPTTATGAEDTTLVLSSLTTGSVRVIDDAGASDVKVTLVAAQGSLTLASLTGLSFVLGTGAGDLVSIFTGNLTNVNAALDGLQFTPAANYSGNAATITVDVDDQGNTGAGGPLTAAPHTITINVTAVNDAPVNSLPIAQSTPEDVPLLFGSATFNQLSFSDVDAGAGLMTVAITVTNGSLNLGGTAGLSNIVGNGSNSVRFDGSTINANAALNGLRFTPTAEFSGNAVLTITTSDNGNTGSGGAKQDADTLTIAVTTVNDPPIVAPLPRSTSEDTALTIAASNLIANDVPGPSNESGQTLTLTSVGATSAQGGTVAIVGGNVVYTPALNFNGSDTFTYVVTDNGITNGVLEPKSTQATVSVTVTPVNDAPTAFNDAYTMDEDTVLTRAAFNGVRANDIDPEGTPLAITKISGPTAAGSVNPGNLTLGSDGSFTYVPPSNYFGTVTFTYRASDGQLNSNVATVVITVNNVNEPPVAVNDNASTTQNLPVTINVLSNDSDADGTLVASSVTVTSSPVHGSVSVNANGTIVYTPTTFVGTDTFQYTVSDNAGTVSNAASVLVTIGVAPPAWQNQGNNLDVNNDTFVSPIDALIPINELNLNTLGLPPSGLLPIPPVGGPPPYYDVDGDGYLAPIDVNIVVNFLNAPANGEGDGELGTSADVAPAALASAFGQPITFDTSFAALAVSEPVRDWARSTPGVRIATADATVIEADVDAALEASEPWSDMLDGLLGDESEDVAASAADEALLDLFGE